MGAAVGRSSTCRECHEHVLARSCGRGGSAEDAGLAAALRSSYGLRSLQPKLSCGA